MKLKFAAASLALILALPAAPAVMAKDANPVKERQKLMRSVGKAMQTSVKMVKGQLDYDAAMIKSAMKTMNDAASTFPGLFPEGSDMDNSIMDFDKESSALPTIWQSMDDFKVKAAGLQKASADAMAAAGSKASFAAAFGAVGNTCKSCHSKYKAKDN